MEKPDVLRYTDYRKYLLRFKKYFKQEQRFFGYRKYSAMLGFSSASELHSIINSSERNLPLDKMVHVMKVLRLPPREADYFELLVHFEGAKGREARRYYWEKVLKFRKRR